MPQQQSPFLEGKYGWNYGESAWNTGMDENLLKFSFMFDGNVDSIVASLPPVSNGAAHFNSADNRFYFGIGSVWYSSPCPKSFIFKIKSNGDFYQFNGTSAVKIDNPSQIDSRLDAVELTLSSLGTAAFQNVEDFATQAELDIVEGQAQSYTDVLRDDLADNVDPAKGAAILGRGCVSIASIADMRLARQDASQMLLVESFYSGKGIGGGVFRWDPTRPKSEHNGWRVIDPDIPWAGDPAGISAYLLAIGGAGNGCWVRVFDGTATPEMAGAVADWNGTTGTSCRSSVAALLADATVSKILGTGGAYWFGDVAVNSAVHNVTRDVVIDWRGSLLVCACDNSQSGTSAALFQFTDCRANISNYTFDDINFTFSGPSRGVAPVVILAVTTNTSGHSIGPMHVVRGQSLLTCGSVSPMLYRSSGINFVGSCTGDNVYYGLNCANNGDNVNGSYSVKQTNRLLFVYGVDGVNVVCHSNLSSPASASVLISNSGTGFPATKNVKCKASFGELNGPIVIADQPVADGTGQYINVGIACSFDALGGNLLASQPIARIGAYDNAGNLFTVEKTMLTDNLSITVQPGPSVANLDIPVMVYTPSANHGLLRLDTPSGYNAPALFPKNASGVYMGPVALANGRYFRTIYGSLGAVGAVCVIPSKYLSAKKRNSEVSLHLRVTARNAVDSSSAYTIREYIVLGVINSAGEFTLVRATQIVTDTTGGTVLTLTVASAPGGAGLAVTGSGYTGATATLTASVNWV